MYASHTAAATGLIMSLVIITTHRIYCVVVAKSERGNALFPHKKEIQPKDTGYDGVFNLE